MTQSKPATKSWTHPSLTTLGEDAVEVLVGYARRVALDAIDKGWQGPPYDPFKLAEMLDIGVVPRDDIRDARVIPTGANQYLIEYNPNRPTQRVRFSVAHEIAHTFFEDCRDSIRNRATRHEMIGDEWQLEMLCNIAASELLMPEQSFREFAERMPSIESLMALRAKFDVSAEAVLLRFARSTHLPCFVFAASRDESSDSRGPYRLDYFVSTASWPRGLRTGLALPEATVLRQATAIDYTTKGNENWTGTDEQVHIEAIGVPPYPGRSLPRVVGVGSPLDHQPSEPDLLQFRVGNATEPHGLGERIIVHIANDKAARWGSGFAAAVQGKWPIVAESFTDWVMNGNLALGACHFGRATTDITVASLIAQHGYGPSKSPRIRYAALEAALSQVAQYAVAKSRVTTVHMPRIGTGQAGGRWELVEEIVRDTLVEAGVPVVVYDQPKKGKAVRRDNTLF